MLTALTTLLLHSSCSPSTSTPPHRRLRPASVRFSSSTTSLSSSKYSPSSPGSLFPSLFPSLPRLSLITYLTPAPHPLRVHATFIYPLANTLTDQIPDSDSEKPKDAEYINVSIPESSAGIAEVATFRNGREELEGGFVRLGVRMQEVEVDGDSQAVMVEERRVDVGRREEFRYSKGKEPVRGVERVREFVGRMVKKEEKEEEEEDEEEEEEEEEEKVGIGEEWEKVGKKDVEVKEEKWESEEEDWRMFRDLGQPGR